ALIGERGRGRAPRRAAGGGGGAPLAPPGAGNPPQQPPRGGARLLLSPRAGGERAVPFLWPPVRFKEECLRGCVEEGALQWPRGPLAWLLQFPTRRKPDWVQRFGSPLGRLASGKPRRKVNAEAIRTLLFHVDPVRDPAPSG